MTGFARTEAAEGELRWAWEIKSVNGRNLDIRARLPAGFDALDPVIRRAVAQRCRRGSLSVTLTTTTAAEPKVRINRAVLDQLLALRAEVAGDIDPAPPRFEALLGLRGVVELVEPEETPGAREQRMATLAVSLEQALNELQTMRFEEGARLVGIVLAQVAEVERLLAAALTSAAAQPEALRARLAAQIATLLDAAPTLPEDRLAQEAAFLATRADVREELDRLASHLVALRALLVEGGAIGRKLDFLCQELNREVNTLCSKSADVELTRIGLDLKSVVDQLREQVQNIE
jgi:uncharacterized protein (TIGR00255 family)